MCIAFWHFAILDCLYHRFLCLIVCVRCFVCICSIFCVYVRHPMQKSILLWYLRLCTLAEGKCNEIHRISLMLCSADMSRIPCTFLCILDASQIFLFNFTDFSYNIIHSSWILTWVMNKSIVFSQTNFHFPYSAYPSFGKEFRYSNNRWQSNRVVKSN